MKRSTQSIKDNIHKFSIEELWEIRRIVNYELTNKNGGKKAKAAFENILLKSFNRYRDNISRNELLQMLSRYTEIEFSKFRGCGEQVMSIAKQELNKEGLKFKENEDATNIKQ